ncbi:MAG: acetate kinase [Faecalibacterium sp.]|nr:acetate kinase [Ruminococcus sp.]MCM1391377.1 acetate kinase [Ruminococcus sp.]MCM1484587.1 acetate kinase [Faecalibacterium sp.]
MSVKELIVNAGSSSLKYTVYLMPEAEVLANGIFEQLGTAFPTFTHKLPDENGELQKVIAKKAIEPNSDHDAAIRILIDTLVSKEYGVLESMDEIAAVGHRVVHGGEEFSGSVLINEDVKKAIEKCIPLGPLHNPANLLGINVCEKIMKGVPQVGVFDTAFHQTMAPEAYMYALPYRYYRDYGIRRYGFHGTSHRYIAKKTAEFLCKKYPGKYDPETLRVVTCHLGNGSSLAAIKGGKCVDTTMGLTPLEGIMMGTRSGSIDPAIIPFLMKKENLSADDIDAVLNKKSGMLGLTSDDPNNEATSDNRTIEQRSTSGDERAQLVEKMFCHQLKKLIGGYIAIMGGADAVVFTGGIGENNPHYRTWVAENFKFLGTEIDEEANHVRGEEIEISTDDSALKFLVIPTDEELMIAQDTYELTQA